MLENEVNSLTGVATEAEAQEISDEVVLVRDLNTGMVYQIICGERVPI